MMSLRRTLVDFGTRLIPRILIPSSTKSFNMSTVNESKLTLDEDAMRIVWMDLEMTGLDPDNDKILELTCAITDSDLNLIAQHEVVIHQSDEVLENMNEWCQVQHKKHEVVMKCWKNMNSRCQVQLNDIIIFLHELVIYQRDDVLENMNEWCQVQHKKTGLVDKVRESKTSLAEAETQTLDFIKAYTMPQTSPLAGNSVHMDKFFMMKQMPQITNYLHYRIIDVSTIKELARRWNTPVFKHVTARKKNVHRAKDDILESITELRIYKQFFLSKEKNRVS